MTAGRRRPSIFQVGEVNIAGDIWTLRGWGLGLCAAQCNCHRHPANGHLYLVEDEGKGTIGLRKFIQGWCACCEPWTAEELVGFLRDLKIIETFHRETA